MCYSCNPYAWTTNYQGTRIRRLSFQSGGPGSTDGNCCGITMGWKEDKKAPGGFKDWTDVSKENGKQHFFCGINNKPEFGGPTADCMGTGEVPNLVGNKDGIPLSWHCDQNSMRACDLLR